LGYLILINSLIIISELQTFLFPEILCGGFGSNLRRHSR
jgi:hypothetical protein